MLEALVDSVRLTVGSANFWIRWRFAKGSFSGFQGLRKAVVDSYFVHVVP